MKATTIHDVDASFVAAPKVTANALVRHGCTEVLALAGRASKRGSSGVNSTAVIEPARASARTNSEQLEVRLVTETGEVFSPLIVLTPR